QMPVIEKRARRQEQPVRGAIDEAGAVGDQLDVLVAVKFVRPERQAVRAALALQVGLRQRRPLIGQMRLIVDQADAVAVAELPQRYSELKARVPGADDQDCSLRHSVRPARCEAATYRARARKPGGSVLLGHSRRLLPL